MRPAQITRTAVIADERDDLEETQYGPPGGGGGGGGVVGVLVTSTAHTPCTEAYACRNPQRATLGLHLCMCTPNEQAGDEEQRSDG